LRNSASKKQLQQQLVSIMRDKNSARVLVIGASGGIAGALIQKTLTSNAGNSVLAVSRTIGNSAIDSRKGGVQWKQSDYSESSIATICSQLAEDRASIERVFICNGLLHDTDLFPEKRLEDCDAESLHTIMHVNAIVPLLWLKHLKPVLQSKHPCVVTVFSARVGSIEDNRLGGWYAYRASKAALNMLLKTAAIEYRRNSPDIKFLAFHPGTTDTYLSKPFQKGVSPQQLFEPKFVADKLFTIIENLPAEPLLNYLDWDGRPIDW
jgi:NAD(P)-dependent dehydrogenase (short-subunit alcohol dehydrogenase family)